MEVKHVSGFISERRVPNRSEIKKFGTRPLPLHSAALYHQCIKDRWRCPVCGRKPQELIRWGKMGWAAHIVVHHCHNEFKPRFKKTIVCEDCNVGEGAVKAILGLPKNFSFSPKEMRLFLKCQPHAGVAEKDLVRAKQAFKAATK